MTLLLEKMNEMFKQQNEELATNLTRNLSTKIDEKLNPLVEENTKLRKQVENLQSKIQNIERESRKNNFILHGIPETETNNASLRRKVVSTLNNLTEKLNMREGDEWEISDTRRLGKNANKPRPILITATLAWRKYEILKNNKNFPTGIYATQDYPKDVLAKREELKLEKKQKEQEGYDVFIRYNKLVVKGKKASDNKRKRSPTKSPPEAEKEQTRDEEKTKINKTYDFFRTRIGSSSN